MLTCYYWNANGHFLSSYALDLYHDVYPSMIYGGDDVNSLILLYHRSIRQRPNGHY